MRESTIENACWSGCSAMSRPDRVALGPELLALIKAFSKLVDGMPNGTESSLVAASIDLGAAHPALRHEPLTRASRALSTSPPTRLSL
jgi:hypothetical protein